MSDIHKQNLQNLDDKYWSERYQRKQTGWDIACISTPLKAYFEQITQKNIPILLPGCGNAHEAVYLAENGFSDITVLDISEELTKVLKKNLKKYPSIKVVHQDFFEHQGSYHLIVEQTFFCAITPALRPMYAQKMHKLLAPKGKLVGLLFERDFEHSPPFGGNKEEYQSYFEPYFTFKHFQIAYNSIAPRHNTELFINFTKK